MNTERESEPQIRCGSSRCTALAVSAQPPPRAPAPCQELLKLQAQHAKLLLQVSKKRSLVSEAATALKHAEQQYALQVEHLEHTIRGIQGEIEKQFEYFLGPDFGLSKRDRNKLRRLQRELFEDSDERESSTSSAEDDTDLSDEPWPFDEAEDTIEDAFRSTSNGRTQSQRCADERPQLDSASKAAEPTGLTRSIFRRLTLALHPDKVQEVSEKEARTTIMQEITGAYDRGDLAALLELERQWLPTDSSQRKAVGSVLLKTLRRTNTALRKQLRGLTAELRELESFAPACGAVRKKIRDEVPPNPYLKHLNSVLEQAEQLRKMGQAFRDQKLTTAQFIDAHYVSPHDPDPDDVFHDILEELLGHVHTPAEPQPRVVRRRSKKTKSRKTAAKQTAASQR